MPVPEVGLLALYVACLVVGGALVGLSALGGGHDADHGGGLDHDGDLDHAGGLDHGGAVDAASHLDGGSAGEAAGAHDLSGHDGAPHDASAHHVSGLSKLPFFSMRFWSFFAACFGLSGVLLSMLSVGEPLRSGGSAVLGAGVGWLAAWVFDKLRATPVSGEVNMLRITGHEAQAVLPISSAERGKIGLSVSGQYMELPARTSDGVPIEAKQKVLVVSVEEGVATVTSIPVLPEAVKQGVKQGG